MKFSEFDAFGPWIYEMNDDYPIPRLFLPYITDFSSAIMSFKVPRNLERRFANADMDLYDYAVIAYEDHIAIHKRIEHSVESISASYKDIEAIKIYKDLLFSECTIALHDKDISFQFNAVSLDIVNKFALLCIDKNKNAKETFDLKAIPVYPESQVQNLEFQGLLIDEKEKYTLGACQEIFITALKKHSLKALIRFFMGKRDSFGALHFFNNEELLVIQKYTSPCSRAYFYIPLQNIKNISFAPLTKQEQECRIHLGRYVVSQPVLLSDVATENYYKNLKQALKIDSRKETA